MSSCVTSDVTCTKVYAMGLCSPDLTSLEKGTAGPTFTFGSKWLHPFLYSPVLSFIYTFVQPPIYLSNHHSSIHLPWLSHPFSWSVQLSVTHSLILHLTNYWALSASVSTVSSQYITTYTVWPLICGINQGRHKQRMSRNDKTSKEKEDMFLTFKAWGGKEICLQISVLPGRLS